MRLRNLGSISSTYLLAAFMPVDPQSIRTQSSCKHLFTLMVTTHLKAVRKTLMKFSPDWVYNTNILKISIWPQQWNKFKNWFCFHFRKDMIFIYFQRTMYYFFHFADRWLHLGAIQIIIDIFLPILDPLPHVSFGDIVTTPTPPFPRVRCHFLNFQIANSFLAINSSIRKIIAQNRVKMSRNTLFDPLASCPHVLFGDTVENPSLPHHYHIVSRIIWMWPYIRTTNK